MRYANLKQKAVDFFSEAGFVSRIHSEEEYEQALELMDELIEDYDKYLPGTAKNALFPRLRRRLRAPILWYHLDTAVVRAVLPCTHEKMTIFIRRPQDPSMNSSATEVSSAGMRGQPLIRALIAHVHGVDRSALGDKTPGNSSSMRCTAITSPSVPLYRPTISTRLL